MIFLLVYLLSGLSIILFTPARRVVIRSKKDEDLDGVVQWKVVTYYSVVVLCAVLLWPLFLKSWLVQAAQEKGSNFMALEFLEIMSMMTELSSDGVNGDTFPDGVGRFGLEATNPIPCASIMGSMNYLSKLRTEGGAAVKNSRNGSMSCEVSDSPIDIYSISDENDQLLATLYISPYQKGNSGKAPDGFSLTS